MFPTLKSAGFALASNTPDRIDENTALWFIFRQGELLVPCLPHLDASHFFASPATLGIAPAARRYLGRLASLDCLAITTPPDWQPPPGLEFVNLRLLFPRLEPPLLAVAGRAVQLVGWQADHQFCGRCGEPMQELPHDLCRSCPSCGNTSYPRLSPAVIMAVTRGDAILLGRAPRFPAEMYSTLAGYVEPGESLEEAVAREVLEETSIKVTNIRYRGSQSWPFPHSLMLGFRADYLAGEITVDHQELEDARWFTADNLPRLPTRFSISRQLIDDFLAERGRQ